MCRTRAPPRNPTTKAVHYQGIQTEISNHVKLWTDHSWNAQYSPKITPNGFQYVHHMLIYLCFSFNETEVGNSAPCGGMTGASVSECRQGSLIAGWAVGGTVSSYPSENHYTHMHILIFSLCSIASCCSYTMFFLLTSHVQYTIIAQWFIIYEQSQVYSDW